MTHPTYTPSAHRISAPLNGHPPATPSPFPPATLSAFPGVKSPSCFVSFLISPHAIFPPVPVVLRSISYIPHVTEAT